MATQTYTQRLNSTANNVLTLVLTETTDAANNTSRIDYSVSVVGSGFDVTNNNYLTLKLGGNLMFGGNPGRVVNSATITSGTWYYTHNQDGTGSFSVECSYSTILANDGSVSATINTTHTATTIPRTSTFTVGNGTLNTAQTISITKANSSYTHTLTYKCGSSTGTITTKTSNSSVSWTPALSLATQNTTGTSLSCTITCTTFNGNTNMGSTSKTITLSIPASVAPTAGNITASEGNPTVVPADPFSGVYIFRKSRINLSCVVSTSSAQGATIVNAYYQVDSYKYNATVTQSGTNWTCAKTNMSPLNPGTYSYSLVATDSRGRTVTKTGSVTVYEYKSPTISNFTVERCNSSGVASDSGTCIKVTATVTYSSLNSKNPCTRTLSWSPATGSTSSKTYSTNSISETITAYTFSGDNPYQFTLTVTDYFNTVTSLKGVPSEVVLVDYYNDGKGMAVGGVAQTTNLFDVYFPTQIRNDLTLDKSGSHIDVNMKGRFNIDLFAGSTDEAIVFGATDKTNNRYIYYYNYLGNLTLDRPTYVHSTRTNSTMYNIGTELDKAYYVADKDNGSGDAGYICIAAITITGQYLNVPIVFEVAKRGMRFGHIYVAFNGAASVDPGLEYIYTTGDLDVNSVRICKTGTSGWRLWIQSEGWGHVCLVRAVVPKFAADRVIMDYTPVFQTGEPSGTTTAIATSRKPFNMSVLWSGTFSSGSITISNVCQFYPCITVVGLPTSGAGIATVVIPLNKITTSDQPFQIHDETNYFKFNVKRSGNSIVLTYVSKSASGYITQVY